MSLLSGYIHIAVIQEKMGSVVVVETIDGMIWHHILLTRQKATDIRCKSLAIPRQFRIGAVSGNVIDQVLRNVRPRSVGQSSRMRKGEMRIYKSLSFPRVCGDEFLHLIQVSDGNIEATNFSCRRQPGTDHLRWHTTV